MQITQAVRAFTPAIEHVAPKGARSLDSALAAGRLPGTREPAVLDAWQRLVGSNATAIPETRRQIGTEGANGFRTAVNVRASDGTITDVVEKSTAHEGAQEHFGWLVARELGIDHRVAQVARAQDGTARIEYFADADGWSSLFHAGVRNEHDLEQFLATCIRRESPELTGSDVTRTARIERQLLQVLDYVLANDDRNLGNARANATGRAVKFFDHGNTGAGQHDRSDQLVPGLRPALQGSNGSTSLDPDVVAYLKRRVSSGALESAHDEAFDAALLQGAQSRATGYASSAAMRVGVVARFQHALQNQGFRYDTPGSSLGAPLRAVDAAPMRTGAAQARFGARGVGGFGDRMI